jgi:hypothetical protein
MMNYASIIQISSSVFGSKPAAMRLPIFVSLFGDIPDPLRPYLPNFRHALVDLKIACGPT